MRKILVISSVLVIFVFLVSCVPQQPLTDEELQAELTKLTPEERAELLKDLEGKEDGALAGQAVAGKYGLSSKLKATKTNALKEFLQCFDTDGGPNTHLAGAAYGIGGFSVTYAKDGMSVYNDYSKKEDLCEVKYTLRDKKSGESRQVVRPYGVKSCDQYGFKGLWPGATTIKIGDPFDYGFIVGKYNLENIEECGVTERVCKVFKDITVKQASGSEKNYASYPLVINLTEVPCTKGCSDGACIQ